MLELTRENFKTEVDEAEQPVLVEFYADWCGPCKAFLPTLEELAAQYGERCKFGRVNIDRQESLSEQFDIMSVPTLILMQDGEIAQRVSGVRSKEELRAILNLN
mgnify:CR=1 FL=1